MCHRDKNSGESIYGESFFDEIKPILRHLEFANFVGGEPFVIKQYYKIWDFLIDNNKHCRINIQTNGSLMNEKILRIVQSPNISIVISLDSIDTSNYEKIRRGANASISLENFRLINKIMQSKKQNMQISVCPITLNADEITGLIDFANCEKCQIFFNYVIFPNYLSLKFVSSSKIQKYISLYEKHRQGLCTENYHEKWNALALDGLINLLRKWHEEAIESEAVQVIAHRSEIADILISQLGESYKSVCSRFLALLPENWRMSQKRYYEFTSANFKNVFDRMSLANFDEDAYEKMLLTFFELPASE